MSMKKRKIKRSPLDIVDRCIDLQAELDEHRRFLGDLTVMLSKRVPQCVVQHEVWGADWIWDKVYELISENRDLKERLAQFSQGNEKTVN